MSIADESLKVGDLVVAVDCSYDEGSGLVLEINFKVEFPAMVLVLWNNRYTNWTHINDLVKLS
jgi:hypothetical protein